MADAPQVKVVHNFGFGTGPVITADSGAEDEFRKSMEAIAGLSLAHMIRREQRNYIKLPSGAIRRWSR